MRIICAMPTTYSCPGLYSILHAIRAVFLRTIGVWPVPMGWARIPFCAYVFSLSVCLISLKIFIMVPQQRVWKSFSFMPCVVVPFFAL